MKKIFLLSIAIIFMFTACFDKSEKNEEKVQNEYTILLEKVVNDAKVYENNLKKAADETFIGEGIYINVLKSDNFTPYEGWYYYSVDELDKLNNEKIAEMLNLLAICGPKGRVYCVFGDKAVGIFDYKGVEDTKLNGKSLDINAEDIINKMDNNGKTELKLIETGNSAKAYVIDYPEITSEGIVIKYKRNLDIDAVVVFYNENVSISSTAITIINEGTAKIDVNLYFGEYKLTSDKIYFGKYGEITAGIEEYANFTFLEPIIRADFIYAEQISERQVNIRWADDSNTSGIEAVRISRKINSEWWFNPYGNDDENSGFELIADYYEDELSQYSEQPLLDNLPEDIMIGDKIYYKVFYKYNGKWQLVHLHNIFCLTVDEVLPGMQLRIITDGYSEGASWINMFYSYEIGDKVVIYNEGMSQVAEFFITEENTGEFDFGNVGCMFGGTTFMPNRAYIIKVYRDSKPIYKNTTLSILNT